MATGVLAVMVTILFALFAEGSNAWRMGERVADVNQGVRTAMELIVREASVAVIDTTNQTSLAAQPIQGLSMNIQKTCTICTPGDQVAPDPSPHGVYEGITFVAPAELGNETTTNSATAGYPRYRGCCGVSYYVAKAPAVNGKPVVLGNLTRAVFRSNQGETPFAFYSNPFQANHLASSVVIAENVLCFRVQPAQQDPVQGVKPANPQMFQNPGSDQTLIIGANNFISGKSPCYPGIYIGLSVVDSRTASRINQLGLEAAAKTAGFQATTNWTLVHFENFKP